MPPLIAVEVRADEASSRVPAGPLEAVSRGKPQLSRSVVGSLARRVRYRLLSPSGNADAKEKKRK